MAVLKTPNSRRNLDEAIKRAHGADYLKARTAMALHHQVAQKLHVVSVPGSDRAHNLIDLQVICKMGDVDLRRTRETCLRLFAYRRQQQWPPTITSDASWSGLYDTQAEGLDVAMNDLKKSKGAVAEAV